MDIPAPLIAQYLGKVLPIIIYALHLGQNEYVMHAVLGLAASHFALLTEENHDSQQSIIDFSP
jgi:hypothetical protein